VAGNLELSGDGRAMKYFELAPFELCVTAATIVDALRQEQDDERAGMKSSDHTQPDMEDMEEDGR
jgi:hypothetical protein